MQLGNWDPQNKVRYISAHQYPDMVKQLFQTSFATEVDPILIYDIVVYLSNLSVLCITNTNLCLANFMVCCSFPHDFKCEILIANKKPDGANTCGLNKTGT